MAGSLPEAEEKARKEAEAKAKAEAEERARKEAEAKARKEAEEKARKEARPPSTALPLLVRKARRWLVDVGRVALGGCRCPFMRRRG